LKLFSHVFPERRLILISSGKKKPDVIIFWNSCNILRSGKKDSKVEDIHNPPTSRGCQIGNFHNKKVL
jgi:hypothetical protein